MINKIYPWLNGQYHALLQDACSSERAEAWFVYPLGTLVRIKTANKAEAKQQRGLIELKLMKSHKSPRERMKELVVSKNRYGKNR